MVSMVTTRHTSEVEGNNAAVEDNAEGLGHESADQRHLDDLNG